MLQMHQRQCLISRRPRGSAGYHAHGPVEGSPPMPRSGCGACKITNPSTCLADGRYSAEAASGRLLAVDVASGTPSLRNGSLVGLSQGRELEPPHYPSAAAFESDAAYHGHRPASARPSGAARSAVRIAAEFGVGGDRQVAGLGGGLFPFLAVGHGLGEGLVRVAGSGRAWRGSWRPGARAGWRGRGDRSCGRPGLRRWRGWRPDQRRRRRAGLAVVPCRGGAAPRLSRRRRRRGAATAVRPAGPGR